MASNPSLLNNPKMAIPPAIYSLIMFFTAAAFSTWVARRPDDADEPAAGDAGNKPAA